MNILNNNQITNSPNICITKIDGGTSGGNTTTQETQETQQPQQQNNNYEKYKEIVDTNVENTLLFSGLKPATGSIYLFDKTYEEGDFTCTKNSELFGGFKIIKEQNVGFVESLCDVLTGKVPEKIIEEYDKNGNLTKKTDYKNDGSYVVSKYNKGKLEEAAEVKTTKNSEAGYKTEINITHYDKDGSYYVKEISYEMNDSCEDDKPKETSNITYYDEKGNIDLLSGLTHELLVGLIGSYFDTNS